jgi:signal transduction histidine kinase
MTGIIENILDFARGRLGGGIMAVRTANLNLEAELGHVIGELQAIFPTRSIDARFCLHGPVYCDGTRMAQLLSNLLANALSHGDAAVPVVVRISNARGHFLLTVANGGTAIAPDVLARLFEPFSRSTERREGLGLGLYIASEIARAHEGTLTATSTAQRTEFTFAMPSTLVPSSTTP